MSTPKSYSENVVICIYYARKKLISWLKHGFSPVQSKRSANGLKFHSDKLSKYANRSWMENITYFKPHIYHYCEPFHSSQKLVSPSPEGTINHFSVYRFNIMLRLSKGREGKGKDKCVKHTRIGQLRGRLKGAIVFFIPLSN